MSKDRSDSPVKARQATRASTATAERARPRPTRSHRAPGSVRDFRGGPRYEITLEDRVVFDFLVSMILDHDDLDELAPADRRWLAETKSALPAEAVGLLDLEGKKSGPPNLPAVVIAHPDVRSPADFVALTDSLPRQELVRLLLSDVLEEPDVAPHAAGALRGKRSAVEAIEAAKPN